MPARSTLENTTVVKDDKQLEVYKKQILWTAIKRGMRENELILGRFARANLKQMTRDEVGKQQQQQQHCCLKYNFIQKSLLYRCIL
jgi:hypothetical protein